MTKECRGWAPDFCLGAPSVTLTVIMIVGEDALSGDLCVSDLSCFFLLCILHVSGHASDESPYRILEYVPVIHSNFKNETLSPPPKEPGQLQET